MKNWIVPLSIASSLPLMNACVQAEQTKESERPNILFIMSDDHTSQSWEFYDLANDPYEDTNRYNNPDYADIIQSMKQEMLDLRGRGERHGRGL